MKKNSIAIIIPVFNVENYVAETLESVKNQLSNPDEVIIINDGSTDNSGQVIDKYRSLEGWKIIHKINEGLGFTRNYGRSIADSEYIYFLDSDDIIKNRLILTLREIIDKNNKPDMILFSGETFTEERSLNSKINLKFTLKGEYTGKNNLITKLSKKKEALPSACRYISKNSLWSNNNINFPSTIYEDEAVFLPLLACSKNTVVHPEIYFKYRVGRKDSLTNTNPNIDHANSYLKVINILYQFMINNEEIINEDILAWRYRLGRNLLNYISMCLKVKSLIEWRIVILLVIKIKIFNLPFKIIWRFLRHFVLNFYSKNK